MDSKNKLDQRTHEINVCKIQLFDSKECSIIDELVIGQDVLLSPRSNSLDSGRYTKSSCSKYTSGSGKTSISSEYSDRKDSLESNNSTRDDKTTKSAIESSCYPFKETRIDSGISSPSSTMIEADTPPIKREIKHLRQDLDMRHHNVRYKTTSCSLQQTPLTSMVNSPPETNNTLHNNNNNNNSSSNSSSKFHFRLPKLISNSSNNNVVPTGVASTTPTSAAVTATTPSPNNNHFLPGGIEHFVHRIRSISIGIAQSHANCGQDSSAPRCTLQDHKSTPPTTLSGNKTPDQSNNIATSQTSQVAASNPHSITSRLRSKSINSSPTTEFIPEYPDPLKLPKEYLHTSINFTNKQLRNSKKFMRMTHSLSCDVDNFNFFDFPMSAKSMKGKRNSVDTLSSTESPALNKIEKYLSGYIDTSTANGALLTVMKQGLKKVSVSDHYMLLSRSPMRSPLDFLQSGIESIEDTEMLLMALHHSTCYDLMPFSGKMIILECTLAINKAFQALDEHMLNWATVWDSKQQIFTGLLSRTDQIYYLSLIYELSGENNANGNEDQQHEDINDINRLSGETLASCLEREPERHVLKSVSPEVTAAEALDQLNNCSSQCLLVLDSKLSGNALFFLDYARIIGLLWDSCKAGLPVPPALKSAISLSDLMMPRHVLRSYYVTSESSINRLLQIMQSNHHHLALIESTTQSITPANPSSHCMCFKQTIGTVTVDDIAYFISKSQHHNTNLTVQTIMDNSKQVNRKISYLMENDSIFDILKCFAVDKSSIVLIRSVQFNKETGTTQAGLCIHSIVSMKDLVQFIMKFDPCNPLYTSSLINNSNTKRRRCFRSVSCCEDPSHQTDMNLSAMSLDEKEEDVFNMEIS